LVQNIASFTFLHEISRFFISAIPDLIVIISYQNLIGDRAQIGWDIKYFQIESFIVSSLHNLHSWQAIDGIGIREWKLSIYEHFLTLTALILGKYIVKFVKLGSKVMLEMIFSNNNCILCIYLDFELI
jgi:hypothetical protein